MGTLVLLLFGCAAVLWLWENSTKSGKASRQRRLTKEKAERDAVAKREWEKGQPNRERAAASLKADRALRDADVQERPYTYRIGRHGNEALAIRYGIANLKSIDPSRQRSGKMPSDSIVLQKQEKLDDGKYRVLLKSHRDREAIAIIEPGTEYVKTFYPLETGWFDRNKKLEMTLKGNGSFSLKELATFHVERAV